jgi:hypothetical protein
MSRSWCSVVVLGAAALGCAASSQTSVDATVDVDAASTTVDAAPAIADANTPDAPANIPLRPTHPPRQRTWDFVGGPSGADGLTGSGESDVWVLDNGSVSQFDGSQWHGHNPEMAGMARGIWAVAPNDVYVAMYANVVLHWNGTMWQRQYEGIPIGWVAQAVWGTGPQDVYLGGFLHSTGDGTWTKTPLPGGAMSGYGGYRWMWGTDAMNLWLVDRYDMVIRKNGAWTRFMWPDERFSPTGTWGTSVDDLWLLTATQVVRMRDRHMEMPQELPREMDEILEWLWAAGNDDVYVGGDRLYRSSGDGRWLVEPLDPMQPKIYVRGIWGAGQVVYVLTGRGLYRGR